MTVFLECINFFSPKHHGFRSRLSMVTQLTELAHDLAVTVNNCGQTDLILLDLSKAFDCVCHSKLIAKVENVFGIGELSAWIKGFLSNRSQFVVYEKNAFQHICSNSRSSSRVCSGTIAFPTLY